MNSTVKTVEICRFLGTTISQDVKWDSHIYFIVKETQQRLYFVFQLRKFNLPQKLLKQFYSVITESTLCNSTVRFSSATKSDLRRLRRIVRTAEHWPRTILIQSEQKGLQNHSGPLTSSTLPIWTVAVWSLNNRTARHRNSFFPQTIHLLNTWQYLWNTQHYVYTCTFTYLTQWFPTMFGTLFVMCCPQHWLWQILSINSA